jgi:hypothetical protein
MRSIKLTVTLAGAAVWLAGAAVWLAAAAVWLAPGASVASAHRHSSGSRHATKHCRVTLSVAPRVITAGESTLAFGRLACAGASAGEEASQAVALYAGSPSASGYAAVGATTTDAQGFYQLSVAALSTNTRFYVAAGPARSRYRDVKVSAQVSLSGPPEGVVPSYRRAGRRRLVTFTGSVSPSDTGALVVLQRQSAVRGTGWRRIGVGVVSSDGSFSIGHRFRAAGPASIRVVVHSSARNLPSASNVLSYEIAQAENPRLTIDSSADPISYGQSVTIDGTLAGEPSTPVKLMARVPRQRGYAPVAQVMTDASGDYAFPAQTPLASTFYRVLGAGRSSTPLYEGVKYVLTAALADATVQAGAPLSISGTVTPDLSGHPIFLERENAAGTHFHQIRPGGAVTGPAYSLAHVFYNAGTYVVRVRIPGDPLHGATVSQPFTVQVTPAPASALTPEAPGSSKLPGEGQP